MKSMKKELRFLSALGAAATLAILLSAGCVATAPPGTVYVNTGPPAALVEVPGVGPGPEYVWISGFHRWDGGHHVWVAGRWEKRPHVNAVWNPGVWRHHRNGWYWTDGRWK